MNSLDSNLVYLLPYKQFVCSLVLTCSQNKKKCKHVGCFATLIISETKHKFCFKTWSPFHCNQRRCQVTSALLLCVGFIIKWHHWQFWYKVFIKISGTASTSCVPDCSALWTMGFFSLGNRIVRPSSIYLSPFSSLNIVYCLHYTHQSMEYYLNKVTSHPCKTYQLEF
jgi:hypothetical protein